MWGELDAVSARWRPIYELKGLPTGASRQGRYETLTQLQDRMVFSPANFEEVGWYFMHDVFKDAGRRKLAPNPRLVATAERVSDSSVESTQRFPSGRLDIRKIGGTQKPLGRASREATP